MICKYGLYADPSKSHRVNLRNHVLSLPIAILESRLSNAACHNLCTTKTPPRFLKSLLGLGMKFCPRPEYTTSSQHLSEALERFDKDFFTKISLADVEDTEWTENQLYIRNETWQPKLDMITDEIIVRTQSFRKQLTPMFRKRKVPSNLTPIQRRLLLTLRHNPDFLVLNSDKNLGPVIMERDTYVRRCLSDHLLKPTYEQLSPEAANLFISDTRSLLDTFLQMNQYYISRLDLKYLQAYLETVQDPFAYFYALAKIHKSPWKTRPIVSVSGSLLYGVGKWLDQQLQPIIRKLPTYLSSSFQLKSDLDKMAGTSFLRMSLFTGDVVAMYPSINLNDAFVRIRDFLRHSDLCEGIHASPIMDALELIMRRNCFRFGDTYWLQKDGTAMGTPPAPSFATLYYGIFELDLLQRFGSSLHYLRRYIDDQFGIWIHHPNPEIDQQRWEEFKQCQDNYCSLNWEFSALSKTINFLDLTLTVEPFHINTKIYEKPLNLHLYIPPNSAHTPSVRTGLVTGGVFRILKLTSTNSDKKKALSKFHSYLFARGYKLKFLEFAFEKALRQFSRPRKKQVENSPDEHVFLHLPFHSRDPTRREIQQMFQRFIMQPYTRHRTIGKAANHGYWWADEPVFNWDRGTFDLIRKPLLPKTTLEPPLYELRRVDRTLVPIKRLIIAYRRPPNLKNLLFPRHVEAKCPAARSVSSIQADVLEAPTNPEIN
mmetsp:Transcript_13423/g.32329  ORF Transcript_13423/g.32329 Transcript_13423/m.32329 type:complete len:711 (-) Transcript_13423:1443-3575(-)